MINCHCRDCQLSSGAPFASGVVVMTADLQISGTPKTYAVRASSGELATRDFCSDCGTPCSRAAKRIHNSHQSDLPRWTMLPTSNPCSTSTPLVHSNGFALIRRFLTFHSRPNSQKMH